MTPALSPTAECELDAAPPSLPLRPPPVGPDSASDVPNQLRELAQWVGWRYQPRDGAWTKVPTNATTLAAASATDPSTWASLDAALPRFRSCKVDGVGFVFSPSDPYAGVDFDDCVDENGVIAPVVSDLIKELDSYSEFSPSGRGIKVFIKGAMPDGRGRRTRDVPWGGQVEVYSTGRFFAVTGRRVPGTPMTLEERQPVLDVLIERFLSAKPARSKQEAEPGTRLPAQILTMGFPGSDEELIEAASGAKNGAKFKRLFDGDTSEYGGDDSAADQALCCHLAFWTGCDESRIDAIFRRSGLYRDKWDRDDYRASTIQFAIEGCDEVYEPPHRRNGQVHPAFAAANGVPTILINTDEHRVIDEGVDALGRDPDLYQRGSALVRVVLGPTTDGGVRRADGSATISAIPLPTLRERLTKYAVLACRKKGKLFLAHPPSWMVGGIAARADWHGIRHLIAIAEAPVLRPDGSVFQTPGYDTQTGVLLQPSCDFPAIPDNPKLDDALAAINMLREVVCDFRFESAAHLAAYIAAVLTALGRHAFYGPTPLFLVDANVRGAGKGLLVQTLSRIALGREMPVSSYSHCTEEMRKKITAIAIAGDSMVLLDNLEGSFGNDALDRVLTSTRWRDRILGKSEQVELPMLAVWFATGNNVAVGADTARRVIPIRLDVLEEHPEERDDFKQPDLLAWVIRERGRLLVAGLTILSAYIKAGRPSQGLRPLGSFEGWSDLVRNAVVWCRLPDPCETRAGLFLASDTTADALGQVIAAWRQYAPPPRGLVVSRMLSELYASNRESMPKDEASVSMRAAMENLTGSAPGRAPDCRKVGNRLKSFRRRVIDGFCIDIDRSAKDRAGATWRVYTAAEAQGSASLRLRESVLAPEPCEIPPHEDEGHIELPI